MQSNNSVPRSDDHVNHHPSEQMQYNPQQTQQPLSGMYPPHKPPTCTIPSIHGIYQLPGPNDTRPAFIQTNSCVLAYLPTSTDFTASPVRNQTTRRVRKSDQSFRNSREASYTPLPLHEPSLSYHAMPCRYYLHIHPYIHNYTHLHQTKPIHPTNRKSTRGLCEAYRRRARKTGYGVHYITFAYQQPPPRIVGSGRSGAMPCCQQLRAAGKCLIGVEGGNVAVISRLYYM
jgi:hypothetical protein